jgi:hypothetical protein
MADVHKFSEQVIEMAERLSDVADAAQGKRRRGGLMRSWLLLPAAGAGLYAFAKSDVFSRQAKEVMDEAKTRASELPDDLMRRVRPTPTRSASSNGASQRRRRTSSTRRSSTARKTTAAR